MRLTYVRWSMTIIETMGATIVTDPVFRFLGLRQAPATYTFEQMPRPDLVFVSHTHLDHFETATLRRLHAGTPVWIPASRVSRAARLRLPGLRGVQPWETGELAGVRLTVVPALHGGGELGLVVQGDRTVYFAGDTSLDRELFRAIGERWHLDAVLLPIGDLRVLGLPIGHIGPRRAPHALRLLGEPHVVVPTHYSGMTLSPIVTFGGSPRSLSQALFRSELGAIVGTTRPLETIDF